MKNFPLSLSVDNCDNFNHMYHNRVKAYLRRDLYEHMLKYNNDYTVYFSFDEFDKKWNNNMDVTRRMIQEVCSELNELGWTTDTSFGDTALFVYRGDKPHNCYPDVM